MLRRRRYQLSINHRLLSRARLNPAFNFNAVLLGVPSSSLRNADTPVWVRGEGKKGKGEKGRRGTRNRWIIIYLQRGVLYPLQCEKGRGRGDEDGVGWLHHADRHVPLPVPLPVSLPVPVAIALPLAVPRLPLPDRGLSFPLVLAAPLPHPLALPVPLPASITVVISVPCCFAQRWQRRGRCKRKKKQHISSICPWLLLRR